jgi:ribosomal protein S18 acetylase RimI-like enzyme
MHHRNVEWQGRRYRGEHVQAITYRKNDLTLPPVAEVPGLSIRSVTPEDMSALERIEAEAFEPRWRHSADGLQRAAAQSVSFDVAELDGAPAGFQFSTRGRYGAHLARMTVARELQGRGIGAVLLCEAIRGYRARGLHHVTLNTQSENFASQKLYTRFGFELTGPSFPVWSRPWPGR